MALRFPVLKDCRSRYIVLLFRLFIAVLFSHKNQTSARTAIRNNMKPELVFLLSLATAALAGPVIVDRESHQLTKGKGKGKHHTTSTAAKAATKTATATKT
jgi:hypothetical protein